MIAGRLLTATCALAVLAGGCSSSRTAGDTTSPVDSSPTTSAPLDTGVPSTTVPIEPSTTVAASTAPTVPDASTTTSAANTPTTLSTITTVAAGSPQIRLPGGVQIESMTWPAAQVGWVLGTPVAGGDRELLTTSDAGATWSVPGPVDVVDASQISFADLADGWIVGGDGVQSTHDGGTTWSSTAIPGGVATGAAVAAASGTVHIAYIDSASTGLRIASSPIDHDAFVVAPYVLPFGAGPRLDVSMSAGGPYAELIYNDRVVTGAAEIRNGEWSAWNLACPYENPSALAGLSPQGQALAIACNPSGFGDNEAVVGADLTSGSIRWVTIDPAGDPAQGQPTASLATATDAGVRLVGVSKSDGTSELAASTDGGATWRSVLDLPSGASSAAIAHLPDGSLLLATSPSGGYESPDGLTWTPVGTTPT